MKVIASGGKEDVAIVYLAEMGNERIVEFVESVEPPIPREKKWVMIVSTLFGCPVRCLMCDAGFTYRGKLSKEQIFAQIDFLVKKRFGDTRIPVEKCKLQFARMGEPSLNKHVLEVLEELPNRYAAPGLIPSVSTIAPVDTKDFFDRLCEIKNILYKNGRFQLQFSIHTTDKKLRDVIIPFPKWDFAAIAEYGEKFFETGERKITLNFALVSGMPVNPEILSYYFSPDLFLIKITPINPTYRSMQNNILSYIDTKLENGNYMIIQELRSRGYEVILSIGEVEENYIGSNCGQFVMKHLLSNEKINNGYSYSFNEYNS
ncbi:MAG: radical SAM protein [Candidatus Schekmanbacteria bacterium RBG_13_48_7]|uniref:Radical SAM protein n=1 Tax=Candidatus Schekmanbacteria bacterium RBG_13_48_7 TaxID=1817878 RepID=A0A1F7RTV5_9BACT|nr:MAG: radical SAM protein [Candidatus Schekmanbacteria bacterium RBG_13_48_7]